MAKFYKFITAAGVFALAAPLLWFFGYSAVNLTGYCIAEKRFLSDDEKIGRAIMQIERRSNFSHYENGRINIWPRIKYESVNDFLAKNPNCCRLNPDEPRETGYSFGNAIYGSAHDIIVLEYKARYMDENGNEQSVQVREDNVVGNCGRLLWPQH